MAVVNQLNLNVGTEQNPNFVLHDINDKRISTTAVTTATHLLTCNSGVTSIAPITAANLASVLGGILASAANTNKISPNTALSSYTSMGVYVSNAKSITETITDLPDGASTSYGFNLIVISAYNAIQFGTQIFIQNGKIFTRYNTVSGNTPSYTTWKQIYDTSLLTDSSLLSSLGLALGVLKYQEFLTNTNLPQGTFASMKDANMNGFYGFSSTNILPSDAPPGVENGAILNITFYSSITLQICFDRGSADTGGSMYSRFYWYGTWFPWK